METKNAVIDHTFLGVEDHNVLTYFLHLKGEGWGQGLGGYFCDHEFLALSIRRILETLEVSSWEGLPHTHVRIKGDRCQIHSIGHILKDQWYNVKEHAVEVQKPA